MAKLLILWLLMMPDIAQAAPVAAAGAAVFGFFATNAATQAIGSLLLSAALSLGASLLAGKPKTNTAPVNKPEVRLSTRQSIPPQRDVYGRVLLGGALFFEECKPPWLYMGLLVSRGPIDNILGFQNNQTPISIDYVSHAALTAPYTGKLFVSFRNGDFAQTSDPILDADFTEVDANFRQRGVATVVLKANFGADQDEYQKLWGQQQKPNILVDIRGKYVYDPRDPTQVLPADPTNQAQYEAAYRTWKWSNNASLIIADYLWSFNGGRVPLSKMDWVRTAASADWDDSLFACLDGTQIKRHTIDGVVNSDQEPYEIITNMLRSNRGMVCRSEGRVWVQSSQPQEPILTITDEMIIGGLQSRRSQPKQYIVKRSRVRFIDPRVNWTTVDGPIRTDASWIATDGEKYDGVLELPFTADHRRAQRLNKAYMDESQLGKQVTTLLALRTLGLAQGGELIAGMVVRIQSEVATRANGLYRIVETGLAENLSAIEIVLKEYNSAIELNWNYATDEQAFTLPPEIET